jgi:hypothetical protein
MKLIGLALGVLAIGSVEAASFKILKKAESPILNKTFKTLSPSWSQNGNCLEILLVKVLKKTEARGRTESQVRQAMTAESIHKYVTRWFDDGVSLTDVKNATELEHNLRASNWDDIASGDDSLKMDTMKKLLSEAVGTKNIVVMDGSASGNNTSGEILAMYDTKTNEILSLIESNFASDSECGDN